jgi:hypothetical protein
MKAQEDPMDAPLIPTTLDDVRLTLFRQHTQIAQLTDELEIHAIAVVASGAVPLAQARALSTALDLLGTHFVRHLDYEEAHLAAWLPPPEADAGPPILGDHTDQRLRLQGLLHDRDVFADLRTVAREALAFVHQLRSDMADEDFQVRALR